MNANDWYLKGRDVIADPSRFTPQGAIEARVYFQNAVNADPTHSRAQAELAYLHVREYQNEWSANRNASLNMAEQLVNKALAIEDNFDVRWIRAIVYWNQGRFDESFAEYDLARGHNPGDSDLADLEADEAEARIYGGDLPTARSKIEAAKAHNPNPPYWHRWNYARLCYMEGRYQDAINAIGQMTQPNDVLLITAASKALDGDPIGAASDMAEFSKNDPNWSIAKSAAYPYGDDSHRQHWLVGLRRAGLKES
jgi:tetratricopeptide (TPR) repeat protein